MKIAAITTKQNKNYSVGHSPEHLDNGIVVEEIKYNRPQNIYNSGFQTGVPGYTITIAGSPVRRLVPEGEVAEILVDTTPTKKKGDEAPQLETFLADEEE